MAKDLYAAAQPGVGIRIAHDPGDPLITSHCPFCGSGQVVGRSDGTISCDFCGQVYIVRVQPAFPGMPQMPGEGGAPSDIGPDGGVLPPDAIGPDGLPMDGADPAMGMDEEDAEGPPFGDADEEEGEPPEDLSGPPEDADEEDEGPPPPKKDKSKGKSKKGVRHVAKGDAEYNGHYNRGWASSRNASDTALERADHRGEPDAWYDGYLDYAVGREKFHSRDCPALNHEHDANCTSFDQPKGSPPDWGEGKTGVRTYHGLDGTVMTEDQYARHLAIALSGGHPQVLAAVRADAR